MHIRRAVFNQLIGEFMSSHFRDAEHILGSAYYTHSTWKRKASLGPVYNSPYCLRFFLDVNFEGLSDLTVLLIRIPDESDHL